MRVKNQKLNFSEHKIVRTQRWHKEIMDATKPLRKRPRKDVKEGHKGNWIVNFHFIFKKDSGKGGDMKRRKNEDDEDELLSLEDVQFDNNEDLLEMGASIDDTKLGDGNFITTMEEKIAGIDNEVILNGYRERLQHVVTESSRA